MTNIFITEKCNLKCPYCFANEFVNKNSDEITIKNFKIAVDFIKTSKNEIVGLIGGEPTLHKHFSEILNILNNDNDIRKYILYTNGLRLHKFISILPIEKSHILINCNSPQNLGSEYINLKNNIKLLKETGKTNYTLGINLYPNMEDYSFIFDLLKISNQQILRISFALPNSSKEKTNNVLDSFRIFKPFLFKFIEDCSKNEIAPYNDCNSIPECLLTKDEKKLLVKNKVLISKYGIKSNFINTMKVCYPPIDIFPDLSAARCFALSKYIRTPISEFKSLEQLRKYFFNNIDLFARLVFEQKKCIDCHGRIIEKCGICFAYKLQRIEELKEYLKSKLTQKTI